MRQRHPSAIRCRFQFRQEKIPLRPLVGAEAGAVAGEAFVGQHFQPDGLDRLMRGGEFKLVDIALGDVAAAEDRAIVADDEVRHAGLERGRPHDPPIDGTIRLLAVPRIKPYITGEFPLHIGRLGRRRRLARSAGGQLLRAGLGGHRPLSRQLRPERLDPPCCLQPLPLAVGVWDEPLGLVGIVEQGHQ